MSPPRALLFDLDGTLLDGDGQSEAVARTCSIVAAARPGLDPAELLAANSSAWSTYWPEVENRWMRGELERASTSAEIWRRALRACRIEDEHLAFWAAETQSREERPTHRLYDDVQDVLDGLKGRFPLGLITNGAEGTQREKLHATGIESAFRVVVISAEVGVAKPDARIFQFALDKLGVSPVEAWHIGNELRNDIEGAKSAGLTAVWLNRASVQRGLDDLAPDIELRSLTQLRDYL